MNEQISSNLIEGTILLHRYICETCHYKNPLVRATAIYIFKTIWEQEFENNIQLLYKAIISLHLASKIRDVPLSLSSILDGIYSTRNDLELIASFPALNNINSDIYDNFKKQFTPIIVSNEDQILFKFHFNLKCPLPYDCADAYIHQILHWHYVSPNHILSLIFSPLYHIQHI